MKRDGTHVNLAYSHLFYTSTRPLSLLSFYHRPSLCPAYRGSLATVPLIPPLPPAVTFGGRHSQSPLMAYAYAWANLLFYYLTCRYESTFSSPVNNTISPLPLHLGLLATPAKKKIESWSKSLDDHPLPLTLLRSVLRVTSLDWSPCLCAYGVPLSWMYMRLGWTSSDDNAVTLLTDRKSVV